MTELEREPAGRRTRRALAALPGLVLVAFATAVGGGAVLLDQPPLSALDGRRLAEFQAPTLQTVQDGTWMQTTESWLDDHVPHRVRWLEEHGRVTSRALRLPITDGVLVDGADGFLLEAPKAQVEPSRFGADAARLGADLRAAGVPSMWMYVPRREEVLDDLQPEVRCGGLERSRPAFLAAMARGGPVVDLTPALSAPDRREDYFWRTDHHWTPAGAMVGVQAISDHARSIGVRLGTDSRTYHNISYPDFYGSLGRKVTAGAVQQPDRFVIPVPDRWRARYCVREACTRPTFLSYRAKSKDRYADRYVAFLGGDLAYQDIRNTDPQAHGTVLLLKDSFGRATATYLAERVSRLVTIDERHYNRPEDIRDVVARVKPDLVVVMHNQISTWGNKSFDSQVWTDMTAVRGRRAGGAGVGGDG